MKRITQFAGLLLFAMIVGSLCAQQVPLQHVKAVSVHPVPSWVTVKDAYEVHERFVVVQPDKSQVLVGEFYVVEPNDVRAVCAGGEVQSFTNLQGAANYVRHCPVPK